MLARARRRWRATPGWSASSTGTCTSARRGGRRSRRSTAASSGACGAMAGSRCVPMPSTSSTSTRRTPPRSVAEPEPVLAAGHAEQRRGAGQHVADGAGHGASAWHERGEVGEAQVGQRRGDDVAPRAGSIGTWCGTAITTHPAASAEATPGRRVLDRHGAVRRHAQPLARDQVGLGVRLAAGVTSSPVTTVAKETLGAAAEPRPRPAARRTSSPSRTARRAARHSASSSSAPGPPRHVRRAARATTSSSSRSTITGGSSRTPPTSRRYSAEAISALPTRLVGVLVGPGAAELGHQAVLGLDPVRLGVDEGAVHVEQHGREPPGDASTSRPAWYRCWSSPTSTHGARSRGSGGGPAGDRDHR